MFDRIDSLLGRFRTTTSNAHPLFDQAIETAVRYYAASWIRAAALESSVRYEAPPDPMKLYEVDPQSIERTVSWTQISPDRKADEQPRFRQPVYKLAGRVFDGDWDRTTDRFTDSTVYSSFESHFIDGVPWVETAFYEETLDAIENGAEPWDCKSRSDLRDRCAFLDELYAQIESAGYLTQEELHEAGDPNTSSFRLYRILWGEITVNVGRNGEFVFQDGRNRLAIARLLGLETVPVAILVRHAGWQRTRDRVARGEVTRSSLSAELREHPDLSSLF